MIIYDWDDTIQKNLNPKSSIGMFLKTIFYPCTNEVVKRVIKEKDHIIITTRSRLYTFAIKLKCFLITWNFNSFSDSKVTTINPYFFFTPDLKKPDDVDMITWLKNIRDIKIKMASAFNEFAFKLEDKYTYVDLDLVCRSPRKDVHHDEHERGFDPQI